MVYQSWNLALAKFLFNPQKAGETVTLGLDSISFRVAAEASGVSFASGEEAVADFVKAVRIKLAQSGWEVYSVLRDYPACIGLLVFQSLVVLNMARDEDFRETAYWPRLRQMLGLDPNSRTAPLDTDVHQQLWRIHLERWANEKKRGQWGRVVLPQKKTGFHHIALPMSQALLRAEDLARLRPVFRQAGLRPEESLTGSEVERHLGAYLSDSLYVRSHAERVLTDEIRRPAALEQIADYLQAWDGSLVERSSGHREPIYRLWAGVRRHPGPVLQLGLAQKDKDGLYRPSKLRVADPSRLPPGYLPIYTGEWLLVWDSITQIYLEKRAARPGERFVLLASARRAGLLESALGTLARSCDSCPAPSGWKALLIQLKDEIRTLPPLWASYVRLEGPRLRAIGGLKLGHSAWVAGSGPAIEVSGAKSIYVDGREVAVRHGRAVSELLDEPGVVHQVWAPGWKRERLLIRVVDPMRARALQSEPWWVAERGAWPVKAHRHTEGPLGILGAELFGPWPADQRRHTSAVPETQLALRLAVALRIGLAGDADVALGREHSNPLLQALAQAVATLPRPSE